MIWQKRSMAWQPVQGLGHQVLISKYRTAPVSKPLHQFRIEAEVVKIFIIEGVFGVEVEA